MKLRQRILEPQATTAALPRADSDASAQGVLDAALDLQTTGVGDRIDRHKTPALIEIVLQTLGRVDLLDVADFRALRLTCKANRDLVEALKFSAARNFIMCLPNAHEAIKAWACGGRLAQRTTSLDFHGFLPPELVDAVKMSFDMHIMPNLLVLNLYEVGDAGEALLAAPLNSVNFMKLTHLYLTSLSKTSGIMKTIIYNPSFAGLRCLGIDLLGSVQAADLVAVLSLLPDLILLELKNMSFEGPHVHQSALRNRLECLYSLHVSNCRGIEKVGLLGAGGPQLPSLRSLYVSGVSALGWKNRPWLTQLTELSLDSVQDSSAIVPALNGSPLKKLVLKLGDEQYASAIWDWSQVDLPQLTSLHLSAYPGDVLADVARAKLPALRVAHLPFCPETSSNSISILAAAFPHICELTMDNNLVGPPPGDAVEALSLDRCLHRSTAPPTAVGAVEEQAAPGQAGGLSSGETTNHKSGAMIEMVIRELGRTDLLSTDSLKALRATCRALRDAVDSTDTLLTAEFKIEASNAGVDALEAWVGSSRWNRRTRALTITGRPTQEQTTRVLSALIEKRPKISKMEIGWPRESCEALLTVPLDSIRELIVTTGEVTPLHAVVANPAFSTLRSLEFDVGRDVEATTLAAALVHFSELRTLGLIKGRITGAAAPLDIMKHAFCSLETLFFGHVAGIDKLGLVSPGGPELPALRTLHLNRVGALEPCSWTSQLTSLHLGDTSARPGLVAVLNGGMLQDLHLNLYKERANGNWDDWEWDALELPHLTCLTVGQRSGDLLGAVARARMPLLSSVRLPFDGHLALDSVYAFAAAFPNLRTLVLWENIETWAGPPPDAALKALSREVIPRLETFEMALIASTATRIFPKLLPEESTAAAPLWPCLRRLAVETFVGCSVDWNSAVFQERVFIDLARAARHCPLLRDLHVGAGFNINAKVAEAFVDAANEVDVWPLLNELCI